MMSDLTLKCDKFGLSRGLHDLLTSGDLVDVTLACQGQFIQAHKSVLAACSPHFRAIFKLQAWQHPIVFMHDLDLTLLQALINYMYNGEVTVNEADLPGFLKLADALKVSGLTPEEKEVESRVSERAKNTATLTHPPRAPPTSPPAKIARHAQDIDVSTRGHSPQPAAPMNVKTSGMSWQPGDDEAMLSEDIKLEVEEVPGTRAPEQHPVNIPEYNEKEGGEEEGESEDEDALHLDMESAQDGTGDSWYEAGTSMSNHSSSQPSTSTEPASHNASSRGKTAQIDEITLSESEDEKEEESKAEQPQPIATPLARLPCVVCAEKFCDLYYLRKHLTDKHGRDMVSNKTCPFCFEQFCASSLTLHHLKTQHPQYRYDCNYCTSTFSTHQYLLNHQFQKHGQDTNRHKCVVCKRVFSSANRMYDHNARYHPN